VNGIGASPSSGPSKGAVSISEQIAELDRTV